MQPAQPVSENLTFFLFEQKRNLLGFESLLDFAISPDSGRIDGRLRGIAQAVSIERIFPKFAKVVRTFGVGVYTAAICASGLIFALILCTARVKMGALTFPKTLPKFPDLPRPLLGSHGTQTMPPPLPKIPFVAHPIREQKDPYAAAFAVSKLALIGAAIGPNHLSAPVALTPLVFTFVL